MWHVGNSQWENLGGEEGVTDEEHELQKWTELECPAMGDAFSVFTGTQSSVEPQDNQVGDVSSILVRRRGIG